VTAAANVIELDFPASSDFLALARQVVVTAARADGGFGEERLENLQLAVSEACTNAIRAHCDAGTEAAIHIRCELGEGRIEVEVVDRGPGFDPELLPTLPAPTDPSRLHHESGLGIALMQLFTDHTEISSTPLGTAVRLVLYALPNVAPGAA